MWFWRNFADEPASCALVHFTKWSCSECSLPRRKQPWRLHLRYKPAPDGEIRLQTHDRRHMPACQECLVRCSCGSATPADEDTAGESQALCLQQLALEEFLCAGGKVAEKEGRISEEGSAGRDVAKCGPWVKESGAEISDRPARERTSTACVALGCDCLPRGWPSPLAALGPDSLSAHHLPRGQVISPVHRITKAADPRAFISRWVMFWTAETKKWATLLKRSCVVMTKTSRLLGAGAGALHGGAAPGPGRQRCCLRAAQRPWAAWLLGQSCPCATGL